MTVFDAVRMRSSIGVRSVAAAGRTKPTERGIGERGRRGIGGEENGSRQSAAVSFGLETGRGEGRPAALPHAGPCGFY